MLNILFLLSDRIRKEDRVLSEHGTMPNRLLSRFNLTKFVRYEISFGTIANRQSVIERDSKGLNKEITENQIRFLLRIESLFSKIFPVELMRDPFIEDMISFR